MAQKICIHRIDGDDRIVFVNEEWLLFAAENDTPGLTRESVYGRPIWDFIDGREASDIYRLLVDRVRRTFWAVTIPFRCDSPGVIRPMEMQILPLLEGMVQFNCWLLGRVEREKVRLFDPAARRTEESLVTCSWCRKVKLPLDGWVEAEDAVRELDLFAGAVPKLVNGMCDSCRDIASSEKE